MASLMTILEVLTLNGWNPPAPGGVLLAHCIPFAGDGGFHKDSRYTCTSPSVVQAKCNIAQALGVGGFIFTYQGSQKPVNQQATIMMAGECYKRGMTFGLLADPALYANWQQRGFASAEAAIEWELTNPVGATLLTNPGYLPEMYFLNFNPDQWSSATVQTTMQKQYPKFTVLDLHKGFSWPNAVGNAAAVLADLAAQNENTAMKLPCVYWHFDNSGKATGGPTGNIRMDVNGADCNTSSWTGATASSGVIYEQAGLTFFDTVGVLPLTSKYVCLETFDDPNEESGFEGMGAILTNTRME